MSYKNFPGVQYMRGVDACQLNKYPDDYTEHYPISSEPWNINSNLIINVCRVTSEREPVGTTRERSEGYTKSKA